MNMRNCLAFFYGLFVFVFLGACQEKTFGDAIVEDVVSVYDGDTFKVNIKGYPPIIGEEISIRIGGIDTPEIKGKSDYEKELALKVKMYVERKMLHAKQITLRRMRRDKYFRILADVYVDGVNLGKDLVRIGYAHPYDGGTKDPW